jgi:hypothetical protein
MSEEEAAASTWVTVVQAAASLGVSEKTIWRRAKAGNIGARKVPGASGGFVWEIATGPTGQATDRPDAQADNRPTDRPDKPTGQGLAVSREVEQNRPDNRPTDRTEATGQTDLAARYVARLEGENDFLRRALEQRDRDAAELRAALRSALKISERALPAPVEAVGAQVLAEPQQAAQEARQRPAKAEAEQVGAVDSSGPPEMPEREGGATWERSKGLRGWLLKMLRG